MSRKLLKILAICVFVTLIPVAIVAIAMTATLSAPFTVKIEVKGELETLAKYPSEISISVNDREKEGLSAGVKANDKVTISFEGVAYDVKGIYDGNSNSITDASKPLDDKASYSFTVSGDRTLTIWVEAKSFDISYSSEEISSEKLSYGDSLGVISGEDFVGWTIVSAPEGVDINNQVYTTATFPISGAYTLAPSYAKYMTINYHIGNAIVEDKVYQNNYSQYVLRKADDEKVANAIEVGYTFGGWATALELGDNVTEVPAFVIGAKYDLYLIQDLNTYTVNVKFHEASDSITELTFNVENGFAEYVSRENYNLKAFKYEDKLYYANDTKTEFTNDRGETLSQVIASEINPSEIVQIVAVWEVNNANYIIKDNFDNYSFYFFADQDDKYLQFYDGNQWKNIEDSGTINMSFNNNPVYDLNQSLFDFFLGEYAELVGPNGIAEDYDIYYYIDSTTGDGIYMASENVADEDKTTFADVIDALKVNPTLIYIYFQF